MAESFQNRDEAMAAFCALGKSARDGASPARLREGEASLEAAEQAAAPELLFPDAAVRAAFALTPGEAVLLALCADCLAEGEKLPDAAQQRRFLAGLGERPAQLPAVFAGGLHPYVIEYFAGNPPRLSPGLRLLLSERQPMFHGQALVAELAAFAQALAGQSELLPAAVVLRGEAGSGRRFLLGCLAWQLGCTLLEADGSAWVEPQDVLVAARLYGALVCAADNAEARAAVRALAGELPLALYLAGPEETPETGAVSVLARTVPPLTAAQRRAAAAALLGAQGPAWESLLALYRPGIGALCAAAARLRAERAAGAVSGPGSAAAAAILREHNGAALAGLADRLESRVTLSDLVLPASAMSQLTDLCAFARVGDTVFTDWGFGEKMPVGRGLSALFYGASGTGKTMAARAVAGELGMELYRVDLARMLSKYVGETQKNISRVFAAARGCDCVLFFDEADALFSRRSEGSDAQDKYANAEIACLLQATEQYDGIILMATNLLQNFDEAFRRRIHFMVHVPLPDEALRLQLWEKALPAAAPAGALDLPLLAKDLELSGAGIRGAVLSAARAAAAAGESITMKRITAAARAEYQKLGKPFPQHLELMYPNERSVAL
jgi:hypothetical protein